MKQITSAIISSFFKDLSSRKVRILLIGIATVALVVIVSILWLSRRSSSFLTQKAALSELSITDEIGNKWTLELVRGQPLSRIIRSRNKPGPPLSVRTNVRKISNSQYSIGITVEGQAGEKYIGGAIKNGKREPEPQFTIMNEKARVLIRGKFEYG